MSKYQEAFEIIVNEVIDINDKISWDKMNLLEELVYRDKTMKPIKQTFKAVFRNDFYVDKYFCPMCKLEVEESDHHCECGQRLDWSEDE